MIRKKNLELMNEERNEVTDDYLCDDHVLYHQIDTTQMVSVGMRTHVFPSQRRKWKGG